MSRFIQLMCVLFIATQAHAEVCGQLAGVKGDGVEILRVQGGREGDKVRYGMRIEQGKVMQLECDDVVITGRDSNAKIILANGKLSLGPDSRIEIAAHAGVAKSGATPSVSLVSLAYGKMRALIQKQKAAGKETKPGEKSDKPGVEGASFRVRTFSAVAGVRGTDFFTSYEPNTGLTEQATIEGAVEVRQSGTSESVLVKEGNQVAVETTPQAVAAYAAELKTGKPDLEPPKAAPGASETAGAPGGGGMLGGAIPPPSKKLQVVAIRDSLRNEIRISSAIVRDDKEFAHGKAVKTLGKPQTWTLEREQVPKKLDGLKNEF